MHILFGEAHRQHEHGKSQSVRDASCDEVLSSKHWRRFDKFLDNTQLEKSS